MKFSEQVELFINALENDEVKLVEGVSISLIREKWLPIIREFEGDPCSVCGTQPALLVDAKEKGTYWMCADCMFETIMDKRQLELLVQKVKGVRKADNPRMEFTTDFNVALAEMSKVYLDLPAHLREDI